MMNITQDHGLCRCACSDTCDTNNAVSVEVNMGYECLTWFVSCQNICNIFQRIQLVQRDETDLCQLLNPSRLHLKVFCSAPRSKSLHDGLDAAAVCPNFNFELSCSLMFQQMFHVQSFNATSCDYLCLCLS